MPNDSAHQHATVKLRRSRNAWFLKNKRLATRDQNTSFSPIVFRQPFVDAAGERAGPVLTYADYVAANGSEDVIKKRLKAVNREDAEARQANAADIIAFQKEAIETFQKRKRAKANETEEKRVKAYNKRVEQFETIVIKMLRERLEGVAWRDIALAYNLRGDGRTYVRTEGVATFKCGLVQDVLRDVTVVPNHADWTNMNAKANTIMDAFNLMWSVGFHDFSFLDAAVDAGDRLSTDLRNYYQDRVTPADLMHHGRIHPELLGLIRSGHYLEALYRRFQSRDSIRLAPSQYGSMERSTKKKMGDDGSASAPPDPIWFTRAWIDLDVTEHDARACFVETVLSRESSLGHVSRSHAVEIADATIRNRIWADKIDTTTGEGFERLWKETYSACVDKFHSRFTYASEYCADVMAGHYGEQPGESDARRARRKQILRGAITRVNLLDGNSSFETIRSSVRWSLSHIDVD